MLAVPYLKVPGRWSDLGQTHTLTRNISALQHWIITFTFFSLVLEITAQVYWGSYSFLSKFSV